MLAGISDGVTSAPGDPALIAKAIITSVESSDIPKHLPLGEFAYEASLQNFKNLISEIESRKDVSLSTDQQ